MNQNFLRSRWSKGTLFMAIIMLFGSGTAAISQSRTVRERNQSMQQSANQGTNLPETRKLMNNGNLFPTQNRTQSMRLEAETGHINPTEDAVLKKGGPKKVVPPAQMRAHKAAHSHSHATVRPVVKKYK
jgi:hypothetical protein